MKAAILAAALLTGAALAPLAFAPMARAADAAGADWPTYGHDAGGDRFSPLTQITPANVARLQPAWTFHMKPAEAPAPAPAAGSPTDAAVAAQREAEGAGPFRGARFSGSEATPLMAGGLLYLSTPYRTVVALEPETGKTAWTYAVPGPGQPSLRGGGVLARRR